MKTSLIILSLKAMAKKKIPEKTSEVLNLKIFFLVPELLFNARVEYIAEKDGRQKFIEAEDFAEITEGALNQFLSPFKSKLNEGEKIDRANMFFDFSEKTSAAELFISNKQGLKMKRLINTQLRMMKLISQKLS